jgi:HSP20 family protein
MSTFLPHKQESFLLPSIDDFHKWVDRFFNRSLSTEWGKGEFTTLPIDLRENNKEFALDIELPGMKKENIKINLSPDNRTLMLSGSKKQETENKEENYYCRQRQWGNFNYQYQLPAEVDPNKIEASYEAGVLRLTLPKAKAQQTQKQIIIK